MAYVTSLLSPTDMKEILAAFVEANLSPSQHLLRSLADVCGITEEALRQHLTECHDNQARGAGDLFGSPPDMPPEAGYSS
ncbi:hypothetical protein [Iodidimonas sp. SYSU 1G8]|uniref:hypothetical protein n=1 Tax=Iodidimonas sp. SYSU 1G8 TaxID=3133967 RepID=UPI0031FE4ABA